MAAGTSSKRLKLFRHWMQTFLEHWLSRADGIVVMPEETAQRSPLLAGILPNNAPLFLTAFHTLYRGKLTVWKQFGRQILHMQGERLWWSFADKPMCLHGSYACLNRISPALDRGRRENLSALWRSRAFRWSSWGGLFKPSCDAWPSSAFLLMLKDA